MHAPFVLLATQTISKQGHRVVAHEHETGPWSPSAWCRLWDAWSRVGGSARSSGTKQRNDPVETRARRDRERRPSPRILRVRVGTSSSRAATTAGCSPLSARQAIVSGVSWSRMGTFRSNPRATEKPGDRPIGVQRAEALCAGGLGALINFDRKKSRVEREV